MYTAARQVSLGIYQLAAAARNLLAGDERVTDPHPNSDAAPSHSRDTWADDGAWCGIGKVSATPGARAASERGNWGTGHQPLTKGPQETSWTRPSVTAGAWPRRRVVSQPVAKVGGGSTGRWSRSFRAATKHTWAPKPPRLETLITGYYLY